VSQLCDYHTEEVNKQVTNLQMIKKGMPIVCPTLIFKMSVVCFATTMSLTFQAYVATLFKHIVACVMSSYTYGNVTEGERLFLHPHSLGCNRCE